MGARMNVKPNYIDRARNRTLQRMNMFRVLDPLKEESIFRLAAMMSAHRAIVLAVGCGGVTNSIRTRF